MNKVLKYCNIRKLLKQISGIEKYRRFKIRMRDRYVKKHNIDNKIVLDVGCGYGRVLEQIANRIKEGYGCDFAPGNINMDRIHMIKADVTINLPFTDDSFDVVICREVIEHLTNPYDCLKEMYRVIKPEGELILTTPNHNTNNNLVYIILKGGIRYAPGHIVEFTPFQLHRLVSQFFEIKEHIFKPPFLKKLQFITAKPLPIEETERVKKYNENTESHGKNDEWR